VTGEPDRSALAEVFETARRLGFLGPGPAADQITHARAFAAILEAVAIGPAPFLDLGSGGGVPGLVLAALWPEYSGTLLDSSERRTAFLRRTVLSLGWASRVTVVEGRAESLAHDPALRAMFPLVVSRSFAAPSVTAEIGGGFLSVGGSLAVSEPNDAGAPSGRAGQADDERDRSGARWPDDRLAELGLAPAELAQGDGARVAVIRRIQRLDGRWPRAVGIPAKRPLW
jgi:16S rRNA (guanine527-N7)-methyltransferase